MTEERRNKYDLTRNNGPRRTFRDPGELACVHTGCENKASQGRYCYTHTMRKHRTGVFERPPIAPLKLTNMSPLGLNITALRFVASTSMDYLAGKVGCSKWTIGYICRGNSCSLDLLWRIAAVFNVEAWRLLKPDEFQLPLWFKERCR